MKDFGNLDGELDEDFLNIGGDALVGLTVASATQNVYPELNEDLSPFDDYDFSDASGSRKKRQKARTQRKESRQKARAEKKSAKTAETLARAELTKSLATDKASDVELAKALSSDLKDSSTDKKPMTTTTKVLIGSGVFLLLVGIGFVIYKKTKK